MQNIISLIPLIFFVSSYYLFDFKAASLGFIIGCIIALICQKIFLHKTTKSEWINLIVGTVLVIMIYCFDDPKLFMLKPTIIGIGIAVVFCVSHLFNLNLMHKLLSNNQLYRLKTKKALDLWPCSYGILVSITNEVARHALSLNEWIAFKVIFIPILSIIISGLFIYKNMQHK